MSEYRDDIESGNVWPDETHWAERAADLSRVLEECEALRDMYKKIASEWEEQTMFWMRRAVKAEARLKEIEVIDT